MVLFSSVNRFHIYPSSYQSLLSLITCFISWELGNFWRKGGAEISFGSMATMLCHQKCMCCFCEPSSADSYSGIVSASLRDIVSGLHSQAVLTSSKSQPHILQQAACWAPHVYTELLTLKNCNWKRNEKGMNMLLFLFSAQTSSLRKKIKQEKERKKGKKNKSITLQAGALPSFLPSLACPSTPPSVQTV